MLALALLISAWPGSVGPTSCSSSSSTTAAAASAAAFASSTSVQALNRLASCVGFCFWGGSCGGGGQGHGQDRQHTCLVQAREGVPAVSESEYADCP